MGDVAQRRHGRTLAEQGDQRLQGVLGAGDFDGLVGGGERLQGERGDAQLDLGQAELAGAGGVALAEGGDAAPRPAVRPGERAGRGGQQDQALGW
ncbi:hypothetical protein ACIBO5_22645 [Nonomuraea angiospora]|uniref:hypothetical protein n=1 Tax=Nonomuraea angiospora TaxID=46172 RepID=UPI0029AF989B|nr:hypothetical protein [Nonomuraea angiospora]MDX3102443.1 hypothetical protein [Nonomuraea angiospora]